MITRAPETLHRDDATSDACPDPRGGDAIHPQSQNIGENEVDMTAVGVIVAVVDNQGRRTIAMARDQDLGIEATTANTARQGTTREARMTVGGDMTTEDIAKHGHRQSLMVEISINLAHTGMDRLEAIQAALSSTLQVNRLIAVAAAWLKVHNRRSVLHHTLLSR